MQYVKESNATGHFDLVLDTSGMVLPHEEKLSDYKTFPIKSYMKVSAKNSTGWKINYGVVNAFFDTCTKDTQEQIAMGLITMHFEIIKFMKSEELENLPELLTRLAGILTELDKSVSLYPSLVEYCRNYLPFGDLSRAGERAQDRPELTFHSEDVIRLTGVVVLSKLMSPIFGSLMYYLKEQRNVESKMKELHCVTILKGVLDLRCRELIDKLKYYIKHSIDKEFSESLTSIHQGLTRNFTYNHLFAMLLIRHFVNVDLYRKNGNLMTYVKVSLRITTQNSTQSNNVVMIRGDSSKINDDDSKKSKLEFDSVISSKTADVPILIISGLDRVIQSLLLEYSIDEGEFETCVNYYRSNPVQVHDLNRLTLHMFMGPYLGGAKSLGCLHAEHMARVVAITQMVCFTLGYRELGHTMSAAIGLTVKPTQSEKDTFLKLNYKGSPDYRNYRGILERSSVCARQAVKRFDTLMSDMVEQMTTVNYIYNTATYLWEILGSEDMNGRTIQFTPNLIQSCCAFIDLTTTKN